MESNSFSLLTICQIYNTDCPLEFTNSILDCRAIEHLLIGWQKGEYLRTRERERERFYMTHASPFLLQCLYWDSMGFNCPIPCSVCKCLVHVPVTVFYCVVAVYFLFIQSCVAVLFVLYPLSPSRCPNNNQVALHDFSELGPKRQKHWISLYLSHHKLHDYIKRFLFFYVFSF